MRVVCVYGEPLSFCFFFFFNDTATTEIYTLSLHDALPISRPRRARRHARAHERARPPRGGRLRSEEHTSELQSPCNLVCRLLLEKKKHTRTPAFGSMHELIHSPARFECTSDGASPALRSCS